jgi:hypothetical protein
LAKDAQLLIDDGKIRLRVVAVEQDKIATVVAVGGQVSNNKGVNVPGVLIPIPALTDKDRKDLVFALEQGADYIALSFVQRPEDVAEARALVEDRAALMAKIEKPQAIERLGEILDLADAVMVARGDLGVELPLEGVPPLQNRIVAAARQAGYDVVVVTRVRESVAPIRAAGLRGIPFEHIRSRVNQLHEVATLAWLVSIYRRERSVDVPHVAMGPIVSGPSARPGEPWTAVLGRQPAAVSKASIGWFGSATTSVGPSPSVVGCQVSK